ncbi:MAG: hypothetical protein LBS79_01905, partial [Tannerella sp.]|nr:hypothetical protein [Tannerella sp.]
MPTIIQITAFVALLLFASCSNNRPAKTTVEAALQSSVDTEKRIVDTLATYNNCPAKTTVEAALQSSVDTEKRVVDTLAANATVEAALQSSVDIEKPLYLTVIYKQPINGHDVKIQYYRLDDDPNPDGHIVVSKGNKVKVIYEDWVRDVDDDIDYDLYNLQNNISKDTVYYVDYQKAPSNRFS